MTISRSRRGFLQRWRHPLSEEQRYDDPQSHHVHHAWLWLLRAAYNQLSKTCHGPEPGRPDSHVRKAAALASSQVSTNSLTLTMVFLAPPLRSCQCSMISPNRFPSLCSDHEGSERSSHVGASIALSGLGWLRWRIHVAAIEEVASGFCRGWIVDTIEVKKRHRVSPNGVCSVVFLAGEPADPEVDCAMLNQASYKPRLPRVGDLINRRVRRTRCLQG